ncbi:hypothetical protein PVK06_038554 [Gossypium arboreum]|uniref:Uncharacterized protein n=1 Tax=Gossypium arboreum TaxID=29729 RepID=A0ABR0N0G8_GOSAR|nr:hypothetical protein PVK06_038554 [Gossypium arboreum]
MREEVRRALAGLNLQQGSNSQRVGRLICWERPLDGWNKVYTDGAFNTNVGQAAPAGVVRDYNGRWLRSSGSYAIVDVKLWRIYDGSMVTLALDGELGLSAPDNPPQEVDHFLFEDVNGLGTRVVPV